MTIRSRKETAWKKSRKFGDLKGGRTRLRMEDNIFARAHSLARPCKGDDLPILMQDNPSRDFFFPLSVHEVLEALKALPKHDQSEITHVWLRRVRKKDFISGETPLAELICGSGVRLIVLYPWPKNMMVRIGKTKPCPKCLSEYRHWTTEILETKEGFFLKWDLHTLRHFYIQHLLYHEVGHHLDRYRGYWSPANHKQVEDFADNYAFQKTATARYVFNRIEKARQADQDPGR
ncbi:MAG: hypothetical protein H6510_04740 [Acidobacteria bacterium]|nr:hypothetical protein [Acidobacteriota bacterium]